MNAAIPERRPATEEVSGLIERVTFHNDESGFCPARKNKMGTLSYCGRARWAASSIAESCYPRVYPEFLVSCSLSCAQPSSPLFC